MQINIQKHLRPNETLLWSDKPHVESYVKRSWFATYFGLAMLIGITWFFRYLLSDFMKDPSKISDLWFISIPVFMSLRLIFAPWFSRKASEQTVYAITDQRVLINKTWWQNRLITYPLSDLNKVYSVEDAHDIGDLFFKEERYRDHNDRSDTRDIGFVCVRSLSEVEKVLKDAIANDPDVKLFSKGA